MSDTEIEGSNSPRHSAEIAASLSATGSPERNNAQPGNMARLSSRHSTSKRISPSESGMGFPASSSAQPMDRGNMARRNSGHSTSNGISPSQSGTGYPASSSAQPMEMAEHGQLAGYSIPSGCISPPGQNGQESRKQSSAVRFGRILPMQLRR